MLKYLVSLSGGVDSCAALARVRSLATASFVGAVGFCYGSKHNKYENEAAKKIADYYQVPFVLIDLSKVMSGFKSDLLKTGGEIPEGHYEAPSMSRTVVPGRNLIFLSILAGLAESWEYDRIVLGVHQGDHHIYPDCRPEFVVAAQETVSTSSEGKVHIETPFLFTNKAGVVKAGLKDNAPFRLTRTCYKDQPIACGKCGSCQERLEAFMENGVADPIRYELREEVK
jgi:7-cyano-7-deazaguanine synthase